MGASDIPQGVKPLRVSEINEAANEVLREEFGFFWVEGELSHWTEATSGHVYFGLNEGPSAHIEATLWKSHAIRLPAGVRFAKGMAVVAYGKLGIYKANGKFQLNAERLFPQGAGAAEEALRRLKEKLSAKGYFSPQRKRPLPRFPRCIALVTSPTGAAIRDMLEVFHRRWPLTLIVVGVRVQGDGSAAEIAAALTRLSELHDAGGLLLDAIIVGRGGGSSDDLGAFNDEVVADAIFQSSVPVVSAVGHEIDITIADLVADSRALTPTYAATDCVPDKAEIFAQLHDRATRLGMALNRLAARGRERLVALASRRAFRTLPERIAEWGQMIDGKREQLTTLVGRRLESARQQLRADSGRLDALSPLNVLNRGYSLTHTEDGRLVRDTATLSVGDALITRVASGRIRSVVTELGEAIDG